MSSIVFVLTENLNVFSLDGQKLKELDIDYKGWYCPIFDWTVLAHHDGSLRSGVCGEKKLATPVRPWWNMESLHFHHDPFCPFSRKSCWCMADIRAPKSINEETYEMLFSIDYIKEYPTFEGDKEKVIGVISREHLASKPFSLHIDIGNKCNFNCSYCPPHTHDGTSPFISLEKLNLLLTKIKPVNKSRIKKCTITGGEPMLFDDLERFVEMLKDDSYQRITINTNGTGRESRYRELIEKFDCKLTFSLHNEFSNVKVMKRMNTLAKEYPSNVHIKYMGDTSMDFFDTVINNVDRNKIEISKLYNKTDNTEYILRS